MNMLAVSEMDADRLRPGERRAEELERLRRRMLEELESFLTQGMKAPHRRWIELAPRGYRMERTEV